jgi:hypothetical protein
MTEEFVHDGREGGTGGWSDSARHMKGCARADDLRRHLPFVSSFSIITTTITINYLASNFYIFYTYITTTSLSTHIHIPHPYTLIQERYSYPPSYGKPPCATHSFDHPLTEAVHSAYNTSGIALVTQGDILHLTTSHTYTEILSPALGLTEVSSSIENKTDLFCAPPHSLAIPAMFGHMHTARPQEERASRRTQKEQKRLASSSHIDSATSSPVPAHSRLSAAARASHLRPSSSKHSTLSRQLSLHQQRNHASPADSTVDSVGPGLSCTNDTLGHDETMGQHEPRSAFRSGLDKVHHFFAPSKSKPVRASARTKAEALQGVPSAGSPLRRGSEVRRPSRRGSSLSKTPAGTVSPGESINTPPQVVDLPPPWTSAHVDENMPPQYQNMDFSVYGGSAARAAANNANKMRLGRRDSQTSVEEQQGYAKGNRESGVDMAQEYNGAMDHLSRRVSVVKPRGMLIDVMHIARPY